MNDQDSLDQRQQPLKLPDLDNICDLLQVVGIVRELRSNDKKLTETSRPYKEPPRYYRG